LVSSALSTKQCFWLITRADQLDSEDDVAEVRDELEHSLREVRPYDEAIASRMFFVDAKRAQRAAAKDDRDGYRASGMEDFEAAVSEFVTGERHVAKMQDLCSSADRVLEALAGSAEAQMHDAYRDFNEVAARQAALEQRLDELKSSAENELER